MKKKDFLLCILLFGCNLFAEFSHWLPVIMSKEMAGSVHFGDFKCVQKSKNTSESRCDMTECNEEFCEKEWTGGGTEAQAYFSFAFLIPLSISILLNGYLSDIFDRSKILSIMLVFLTAAHVLTGFTNNYWALVVFRVIVGFSAAYNPINVSLITDSLDPENRAFGMSIVNWGIYLGYGMSYGLKTLLLPVSWLGVDDSWRWAFWLSSALGVVLIPSVFFLVNDPTEKSSTSNYFKEAASNSKFFFAKCIQPSILFLILGGTLRNSAGTAWGYNQVLFLSEKENSEDYNIDLWLMTCTILCGIPGAMLGGYINDRIKSTSTGFVRLKRSLRFVAGALLLCSPLLTAGFYLEIPILFAPLFIGYFITEMWYAPYLVAVAELFPENSRGLAIGYTVFLLRLIGGNLPSLLVGPLKNSLDYFWALFILIPSMNILAAIIFLSISFFPFSDEISEEHNKDFQEF